VTLKSGLSGHSIETANLCTICALLKSMDSRGYIFTADTGVDYAWWSFKVSQGQTDRNSYMIYRIQHQILRARHSTLNNLRNDIDRRPLIESDRALAY